MTEDEIKNERENMYIQIKQAQDRLTEIRTICKHGETFESRYGADITRAYPAELCSFCHCLIRYL